MKIEKTSSTPMVHLSAEDCIFEISGNSFSENLNEIYEQVVNWIDNEVPKIECELVCKFDFHVFNSVTYKNLLLIISKFNEQIKNGKKVKIIWLYDEEDEDSMAVGEDLSEIFDIPVELIAI